jgi:Tfp pilus assembly protein PilF
MALCGLLAFGTKENAAMLPVSLFLYDLFLIRGISDRGIKTFLKYGTIAAVSVLAVGLFYIEDLANFSADYQMRPFTMVERLLTQPRVLILYISLILYPITSRLMLVHDIDLSTSLFTPWTTLPAIILIILIVVAAFWWSKRWPLISYCVLFFFVNHFIEGSFIPLELIYEHRNYLPSLLFFVPITLMIVGGLRLYADNRGLRVLIVMAVIFILILQGVTVYIQNNIYKDDISLWTDNREKSPRLHTVRQNLATSYFLAGRLPEAFVEGQEALRSYQAANPGKKSRTHGLVGEYYFKNNQYDQALPHYEASIKLDPSYHVINRRISEIMLSKGRLQEAEYWIKRGLAAKPQSFSCHAILARILLKAGSYDQAMSEAFKSLRLNPNQAEPYAILADAFRAKGKDVRARHFRQVAESVAQRGTASSGLL